MNEAQRARVMGGAFRCWQSNTDRTAVRGLGEWWRRRPGPDHVLMLLAPVR